jgi:hypothetical protein
MPSSGCAALAEVRKDDGSKCPDLSHRIGVERMTPGELSPDETKRRSREPLPERIHAFVIFDVENDRDLYDRILSESRRPNSDFDVMGGSERSSHGDAPGERARNQIREADQVIVICGETTDASVHVFAELRIVNEEQTPYFLLWGRRGTMCTKPMGSKRDEGMYIWSRDVLYEQISLAQRTARSSEAARLLRRVVPTASAVTDAPSKRLSS